MIKKINKTEKILLSLPKTKLKWSVKQQERFDNSLIEMQRDSRYKQAMSEIKANNTYLHSPTERAGIS
jgi:hypothetical protein